VHSAYSRALYPAWFADPQLAQAFTAPRSDTLTGASVSAGLRRDGYDWCGLIRAISAPALVIHGELDLLPPSSAHELAALIPGARLELLPRCGHMPFWEAPETFFQVVESFLSNP
jgi:pimeloyl-ACP methyl ester carboxylesterase